MGCSVSKSSTTNSDPESPSNSSENKIRIEKYKSRVSSDYSTITGLTIDTTGTDHTNTNTSPKSTTSTISKLTKITKQAGSSLFNFRFRKHKKDIEYEMVDPLYVIIPYFNFCGFKRRLQLFLEFYKRICDNPRIRIVVCEAAESGKEFELPKDLPNVFLHLHIRTKNQLWIKENLINIAVRRLPPHWKFMAWLDSDIEFSKYNWVEMTLERLQKYDVIQLYSTVLYLGPNNEPMKTDRSFGYMYRKSGKPYTQTYKYGFWHPGFAWACTKKAYQTMDGLIDFGILGSGDHHMALGLISKIECSHPKNIHPNYRKLLRDFEKRVRPLKLGYMNGTISHYWHGDLKLRRYKERWNILTEHEYDPLSDIYKDPMGLNQFTESGKKIEPDIRDYFEGRLEDDTKVFE